MLTERYYELLPVMKFYNRKISEANLKLFSETCGIVKQLLVYLSTLENQNHIRI